MTASFEPKVTWLVWPAQDVADGETFERLVLAVDEGVATTWHTLGLPSGELRSLSWPAARG